MLAGSQGTLNGTGVLVIRVPDARRVMLSGGYAEADALINSAYERIACAGRAIDWLGRIGDHDFVMLLPRVGDPSQAMLAANKILRGAEGTRRAGERVAPIRLVVGVAAFPGHGEDAQNLLWAAEGAAELAERQAVSAAVADLRVDEQGADLWRVEALLGRALETGELELHYQPKVRLADHALAGFEGLSRWFSPELGRVDPSLFVPIAEKGPHMEQLLWSTVHTGLNQLADWRASGFDATVAINLSPTCLRSADLAERIGSALALWNVPGQALTLEVTESAIMPQPKRSFAILNDLRALGVRISIDDFGTGYSSLAYFRALPADELKIDRSFVAMLTVSEPDCHIVQSVIDLAHRLDLSVVAEGIEDLATADLLTRMGCDVGQGYYFGQAICGADAQALYGTPVRGALAQGG